MAGLIDGWLAPTPATPPCLCRLQFTACTASLFLAGTYCVHIVSEHAEKTIVNNCYSYVQVREKKIRKHRLACSESECRCVHVQCRNDMWRRKEKEGGAKKQCWLLWLVGSPARPLYPILKCMRMMNTQPRMAASCTANVRTVPTTDAKMGVNRACSGSRAAARVSQSFPKEFPTRVGKEFPARKPCRTGSTNWTKTSR